MDKSKNTLIGVLICVILVLCCVIAFTLGMKYSNKENINENTNNGELINEKQDNLTVTEIAFDGMAVTYNGEVYVKLGHQSGLESLDDIFGNGTIEIWNDVRNNKYQTYTFGNLKYLDDNNSEFSGLKLNTKNVKYVYSSNIGQGIQQDLTLILLHDDNTLSTISIYSIVKGDVNVEKLNGLSEIDYIVSEPVEMGGFKTYAVKLSGEKINLDTYIK